MKILNKILHHTYKPLLERYVCKNRVYYYKGIDMLIYRDLFHPGFFCSTKYVVNFLKNITLQNKSFLEVVCGSGMISIFATKQEAKVTAIDIRPIAQKWTTGNAFKNNIKIKVVLSDVVMITPPYFKKNPESFAEHAWYAGENLQYFENLFGGLKKVSEDKIQTYMVLADN